MKKMRKRKYFSPPKATIFEEYTKLEMKAGQVSYMHFSVAKIEYIIGHQNQISAFSIWLSAPKEIVDQKIAIAVSKEAVSMRVKDAKEQTKLVCDWSP